MSPEEACAFIRKVTGPPRRTLVGEERAKILTVLQLLEPVSSSNNQRTWTDVYKHAGREYHATYGDLGNELPIIEVIDEE